jgi:hypothetical protein
MMRVRPLIVCAAASALVALPGMLSAQATEAQVAQITVEAVVAEAIVDRMPQNPGNEFAAEVGNVSVWTNVTGAEGSSIQHVWIFGEMEFPVTLQIAGSPWRTWSTKEIPPDWLGEWRVEIRDAAGNALDTVSFTIG